MEITFLFKYYKYGFQLVKMKSIFAFIWQTSTVAPPCIPGFFSAAHLMQCFGLLQVLHTDFEAVGIGNAGPFNLRIVFLWHVESSKLVLEVRE